MPPPRNAPSGACAAVEIAVHRFREPHDFRRLPMTKLTLILVFFLMLLVLVLVLRMFPFCFVLLLLVLPVPWLVPRAPAAIRPDWPRVDNDLLLPRDRAYRTTLPPGQQRRRQLRGGAWP